MYFIQSEAVVWSEKSKRSMFPSMKNRKCSVYLYPMERGTFRFCSKMLTKEAALCMILPLKPRPSSHRVQLQYPVLFTSDISTHNFTTDINTHSSQFHVLNNNPQGRNQPTLHMLSLIPRILQIFTDRDRFKCKNKSWTPQVQVYFTNNLFRF